MAYITKEQVKEKTLKIKEVFKKYNAKGSVSGSNSSSITVKIASSPFAFDCLLAGNNHMNGYGEINHYWYTMHNYTEEEKQFIKELLDILKEGHYDESDIMTDYFHCAWYIHIKVGNWNKPYIQVK